MQVKVTLVDTQGRLTSMTLTLDPAITTIADALTSFQAWQTDYEAASGLGVVKAQLSTNLAITPSAADAGSNIDEGFVITALMDDGDNYSFRFPAPAKTAGVFDFVSNGQVNVADTQVSDLMANYQSGGDFRVGKHSQRIVDTVLSGYLEGR